MHLNVILSVLGQLVAVPCALLLLPNWDHPSPPVGASGSSLSNPDGVEDTLAPRSVKACPEIASPSLAAAPLVGIPTAGREKGRKAWDDIVGDRDALCAQVQAGVDHLKKGWDGAVAGVKETFIGIAHPLQSIPTTLEGMFAAVSGARRAPSEDRNALQVQNQYLSELELAQESARLAMNQPGWSEVTHRDGITVWKKYFSKDTYGYQYPCVKAQGLVEAPARDVMEMIVDSTRVMEYNRYSKGRTDIERLGPDTKIVWNRAQPPLSSKLHDFCTLMHLESLEDGGYMLITRATEHPGAPLLKNHVRSEILLGVTVLVPAQGNPHKTEMTTVNHIVSNGVPVMIADRVSTKNAIDFILNVGQAASVVVGGSVSDGPLSVPTSGKGDVGDEEASLGREVETGDLAG